MKRKNLNIIAAAAAVALCMMTGLTGCGSAAENTASKAAESTVSASVDNNNAGAVAGDTQNADASAVTLTNVNADELFTERDLAQTADTSDAKTITVKDGEDVNITSAGVYVLSGTASNCTVRVEIGSSDKVQLVLDGLDITNESAPAIYVVSADKCFVTTADGESSLSVTGTFTADGDTNTDAVIFSKDDIVLNGTGTLTLSAPNGSGVAGKDDLKVTGGTYSITCGAHAVEANDSITIGGGTFTINAGKDGFHCNNSDDDTKGDVIITDGTFNITAGSDGVQGTTFVRIDGGTFDINSSEGIEATYVEINGGEITITASDDGINASANSTAYEVMVVFNGGYTTINMGAGDTDGVDANGKVVVNGGTVSVNTSGNSFDYDTGKEFNGGTIIINGEEVSEIPEDMMGGRGGFGGGFGKGNMGEMGERSDMGDMGDMSGEEFKRGHGGRGGFGKGMNGEFTPPEGGDFGDMTPPDGAEGEAPEPPAEGEKPADNGAAAGTDSTAAEQT